MSQIKVPIEPHWAGNYHLVYDGKYLTLHGKDRTYPVWNFGNDSQPTEYEDMVLVSCITERRGIAPEIVGEENNELIIELNEL